MTNPIWPRYGEKAPGYGVHGWIADDTYSVNVSDREYHSWSLPSASFLKDEGACATPADMLEWLNTPGGDSTDATIAGTLLHAMTLDVSFTAPYLFNDTLDRRTKAGKEAYAEACEAAGDGPVVKASVYETARIMADAVEAHDEAMDVLVGDSNAITMHEVTAIGDGCKARVDSLKIERSQYAAPVCTVADVKSTRDISPRFFEREIATRGYHTQLAHYIDVLLDAPLDYERMSEGLRESCRRNMLTDGNPLIRHDHTVQACIVAVQSVAPYHVVVYDIPDEAIEVGRKRRNERLAMYRKAVRTGDWPGYPARVDACLPRWEMVDDMQQMEVADVI